MYWDVVEVKSEPDYCLFVRFKDGLAGQVRLHPEELTGVLTSLRDVQFFERVFIRLRRGCVAGRDRSGAGCNVRASRRRPS